MEVDPSASAPEDETLLGRALRAVEADDTGLAQQSLLRAWRKAPHPGVAEALDLVAEEHLARHGALREKGRALKDRLTKLSVDLPAELQPAFCATLNDQSNGEMQRLMLRVEPDPRWTSPLLRRISASKRWTSSVLIRFLRFLQSNMDMRLSRSSVDERGVPTFDDARFALLDPDRSIRLSSAVFALSDQDFGVPPALDVDTQSRLAKLLDFMKPMQKRRLEHDRQLSEFAADRDDTGLELLADRLEEHGYTARARFVRLQAVDARGDGLSRADRSEAKALSTAYKTVWAGPFSDLADKITFERGVPQVGRRRCTRRALEIWAHHPLYRNLSLYD